MKVGTLIIGTEVDTSGFERQYAKLERDIQKKEVAIDVETKGLNKSVDYVKELEKQLDKVDEEFDKIAADAERFAELNEKALHGTLSQKEGAEWIALEMRDIAAEEQKYLDQRKQIENSIDKENEKIEKQKQKIEDLTFQHSDLVKKAEEYKQKMENVELGGIQKQIEKVGNGLSKVIKQTGRWVLAIFGIRSAYLFVRQAMSTLSSYNEQLATDLQYIRFAVASVLQPVIERIVQLAYKLLGAIGSIFKTLFGINIFANATSKAFGKTNESAKELKKTLAGFDEVNVLNSNGTTGIAGNIAPSFDLGTESFFANLDLQAFIEKGKEIAASIANGINLFFETINWKNLGKTVGDALVGIVDIVIEFIRNVDWFLIGKSIADFLLNVNWGKVATEIFQLLIDSMIASMNLVGGVTQGIIDKLTDASFYKSLNDTGKEIIKQIVKGITVDIPSSIEEAWSKIFEIFFKKLGVKDNDAEKVGGAIGQGISAGLDAMIEQIPFYGTFYKIVKFAKKAFEINSPSKVFKDIGKNLIQGLIEGMKNAMNGVIDLINTLIRKINGALNFKWNDITIAGIKLLSAGSLNVGKIPTIPRLAKGTILNNPGKGVPVAGYSAIAAEAGREAYIPLSDTRLLEELGQTMGKYVRIDNIVDVFMDSRRINRILQQSQNRNDFALNK